MISDNAQSIVRRAKALYESQWKTRLEAKHRAKYVAIEPDSGEYFLGETYGEAVRFAREAHPGRISFVLRVGHEAAIHMGAVSN